MRHPYQPSDRFGDFKGRDIEAVLGIVGAEHDQYQVQRFVRAQAGDEVGKAAHVILDHILPDCGTSVHAFFDDLKAGPEPGGHVARPAGVVVKTVAGLRVIAPGVGVAEAQDAVHGWFPYGRVSTISQSRQSGKLCLSPACMHREGMPVGFRRCKGIPGLSHSLPISVHLQEPECVVSSRGVYSRIFPVDGRTHQTKETRRVVHRSSTSVKVDPKVKTGSRQIQVKLRACLKVPQPSVWPGVW